jgi:GrpB-like predicted nucleotidyltransferase (UPF0157 family)
VRDAVRGAFRRWSRVIAAVLPGVDVQHVGATAVSGSLTKGDLDINVRVPSERFAEADRVLSELMLRNEGSTCTPTFSAFEAAGESPNVGVQLCTIGSEDDFFVWQREKLRADESLRREYDAMKRAFHGRSHDEYREAKAKFWEKWGSRS